MPSPETAASMREGAQLSSQALPCLETVEVPLHVNVDVRGLGQSPMQALRVLLVADVLRRLAEELHGVPVVLAVLDDGKGTPTSQASWTKTFRIQEPSLRGRSESEVLAFFGGPAAAAFKTATPAGAISAVPGAGKVLEIGPVQAPVPADVPPLTSGLLGNHDPLALRLCLLRFPYAGPAVLSRARLHRAEETLQRWRFKVANWKDMPVAHAVPDVLAAADGALTTALDTASVLTLLHRLETDQSQASGSKFATFTRLDRVLGLDLLRMVGKIRW
ncbi:MULTISPECIES: hypothetical protein [Paenarthrobacter]|uniref:hypothetical protein n=1 Tax=Paenarthrobacter TaxID=1742992 RepID=UPI00084ECC93|nr:MULTISPECIES: hypothetical protein [Paenarthrobacter]NKR13395.1 hypothetical protein [Arthrobacter sp. M5]NKR14755.1 hypothetical protein [Arthrobacter sp. M6]OEH62315.1 hypothetical protein A5N13_01220 [Arthrobacter sp. D4]OEH62886.1 hypothetical protein A5N17_09460 [Arthrobacter sp. D2]MDO5865050.1 hypothetical protein [Paenarthrobacter sp. SD-2]